MCVSCICLFCDNILWKIHYVAVNSEMLRSLVESCGCALFSMSGFSLLLISILICTTLEIDHIHSIDIAIIIQVWLEERLKFWYTSHRACHRYGNTCGDWVMGTVSNFSTPRHTAYPYCSIMGMIQVNYNKVGLIFTALKLIVSDTLLVFFGKFKVSYRDRTKYGCQAHIHLCFIPSSSHSHSHTASKAS